MIKLLGTVKVPKSLVILAAVANAAQLMGILLVTVTSGNDSTHLPTSKHYTDEALDFRTHDLRSGQAEELCSEAQARLGRDYQCILEALGQSNEHLHVEYDPH